MRRLPAELEAKAPRINPKKFTDEKSARELELCPTEQMQILELHTDYDFVGWALSVDVQLRESCDYVIMCQKRDDGQQYWCHCAYISLQLIIEKITDDPSRIARN